MTKRTVQSIKRHNNRTNQTTEKVQSGEDEYSKIEVVAHEKLYVPSDELDSDWKPACNTVFKILLSVRMAAAMYSIISDCDEVYNYWEPLHLFLYGEGLQTWEYSPVYAIRSYFYIYIHSVPAQFFQSLMPDSKIFVFMCIRCTIGFFCATADTLLYYTLTKKFSNSIGAIFIVFTIFGTGMFIASTSFLPSSFSMIMTSLSMAAYLSDNYFLSIYCIATSTLLGWPFAAVLGLPIIAHMVFIYTRKYLLKFVLYALISGVAVAGPMIYFDTLHFGKTVFAPLNIILYNVFSSHGPDLYGTAPLSYYIKNLLLNWNIAFPLLFLSIPLGLFHYNKVRQENPKIFKRISHDSFAPLLLIFCTIGLWFFIFFLQPHKEERFMYPIYPLISILAAVGLEGLSRFIKNNNVIYLALVIFTVTSISRSFALSKNYGAPIELFKLYNDYMVDHQNDMNFAVMNDPVNFCVGDEWYEVPSSFFLPGKMIDRFKRKRGIKLQFVKDGFRGLLPKYYAQGKLMDITKAIPSDMNDQNKEETSRYIKLQDCNFLLKLVKEEDSKYKEILTEFEPIVELPYLNAEKTPSLARAFYIPIYSDKKSIWASYKILKRR
uniref:Mannosyltransferase n=1 Tax=Rhabditophanes sp. KR3021 TaxID=114890 RepID=A0AC35UA56_9BILA